MNATYDRRTDSLTLVLKDRGSATESNEASPGVILDYDQEGDLISLEVLDASTRVSDAHKMEFQISE